LPARIEELYRINATRVETASFEGGQRYFAGGGGSDFVGSWMAGCLLHRKCVGVGPIVNVSGDSPHIRDARLPRREGQAEVAGDLGIADSEKEGASGKGACRKILKQLGIAFQEQAAVRFDRPGSGRSQQFDRIDPLRAPSFWGPQSCAAPK
jgi:hypothetical protein